MKELWKDVEGYEEFFMISNLGNLYSKRSFRCLKLSTLPSGYVQHTTRIGGRGGKSVAFRIHRLVAKAFISNPEGKPEVNHKNGNKSDNSVSNLEWVTPSENIRHAFDRGLSKARGGIENHRSKLSLSQVAEIKERRLQGETCRSLAQEFGVHHMQISRICRGVSYKTNAPIG